MKKTIIGHMVCPVCRHKDAEIKEDKNGHSYMHCTDCNAQLFTRNDHRDSYLRANMRPVTVTGTDTEPPATVTDTTRAKTGTPAGPGPEPAPAVKKVPTLAPKPPPAPPKSATLTPPPSIEKKRASGWLTPVLGVRHDD